jgi:hypothetical protein
MMTFLTLLILFLTAFTAGQKCAARGYRTHGVLAFAVLLSAYLLLLLIHAWVAWVVGGVLMAIGTWIVLRCINLPRRTPLPTSKGDSF